MSQVTAAPTDRAALKPDREHALAKDVLGLPRVLFCIVTGAAPIAAMMFNVPWPCRAAATRSRRRSSWPRSR